MGRMTTPKNRTLRLVHFTTIRDTYIILMLLFLPMERYVRLSANQPSFATNGLIAYFPFDGSVSNAQPGQAWNPIHASISYVSDRFGRPQRSALFDGRQSFVAIDSFFSSNSVVPLTLSLWFRPFTRLNTRNQAVYLIGATGESDNRGIGQSISTAGAFDGSNIGGPYYGLSAFSWIAQRPNLRYYASCIQITYETNRWSHVAATFTTNEIRLYINGILQDLRTLPGIPITPRRGLVIGAHKFDSGIRWPFHGAVDDVRVYGAQLDGSAVSELYRHEAEGRPAKAVVSIEGDQVVSAGILDPGYGYMVPPRISFSGPGVGAIIAAQVTNGSVASLKVFNPGMGYSPDSHILVSFPKRLHLPALAAAKTVAGGSISAVLTDPGYGYSSPPEVRVAGGNGQGASVIAVTEDGVVTSLRTVTGGTGYTTPPAILIAPPNPAWRKAEAVSSIVDGIVDCIGMIDSGQGYDTPPTVLLTGG